MGCPLFPPIDDLHGLCIELPVADGDQMHDLLFLREIFVGRPRFVVQDGAAVVDQIG